MKFSVIICTFNRPELITDCLALLAPGMQTQALDTYEVIVSDDNKNTITKDLIQSEFPWVKWVKGPEKGFSANRNNGAKHASGDWLLLVDDDCLPDTGWIKGYADAIQANSHILVFEGKTIADRPRERYDEESPVNENGGNFWGCNQCVKKDFYFNIGGMPEVFNLYMEDIEFKLRILKTGSEFFFTKEALVVHPWRKVRSISKQIQVLDNVLLFLTIHPEQRINFTFKKLIKNAIYKTIYDFKLVVKLKFNGLGFYFKKMFFLYYRAFYISINSKKITE